MYTTAKYNCGLDGAHVVDIQTSAENDFVRGLVPPGVSRIYLGYERNAMNQFVWSRTGKTGPYTNWLAGEPYPIAWYYYCAEMDIRLGQGGWSDNNCYDRLPYVCKIGKYGHSMQYFFFESMVAT